MGCGSSKTTGVSETAVAPNDGAKGQCQGEVPPISLPRKTKAQLIPDPTVFSKLDDLVRKTPDSATSSMETLAAYLTSKCRSDLEKIRALFCWLAYNISYDTESYFSGDHPPQDAAAVLRTGKAVCQGYSELFEALCKLANIPCVLVSGIAKGFSHDPENVYTAESKTNHAWNLVLVQGEWRPLDSTWGAGHVDKAHNFKREFSEHWFLTDPEEFLPRHFPLKNGNLADSKKYQLLKNPISIEHFSASTDPREYAYTIGLQCLTHDRTVIEVKRDVTVKLKASRQPLKSVTVTLTERGSQGTTKDRSSTLLSIDDDGTCTIYIKPPRVTTYLLDIFGLSCGQVSDSHQSLLSYVIKCKETHPNTDPFPDKFGTWGLKNPTATECGLKQVKNAPFLFNAKDGQVQVLLSLSRFTMLSTNMKHARTMDKELKQYTFIEHTEDGAIISARLPEPGYYKLGVFADHPEQTMMPHVGDFLLYADKGRGDCQPFPLVYRAAGEKRTKLLQPLNGQLPSGTPTLFRMRAPNFGKAKVGKKMMEMKNDGVWEAEVTPDEEKNDVTIYAAVEKDATSLDALYKFTVG